MIQILRWELFKQIQNVRISLQQRPFLTVPFLGKGPAKPEVESKMLQGSYLGEKKSCKSVMEKSLREEPLELVPSLKATIQNPANICEDIAAEGWIRGGLTFKRNDTRSRLF